MPKGTDKIPITLRLDSSSHAKLKVVSSLEIRSLNSQIEYFIVKGIENFEKENGPISIDSE